MNRRNPKLFDAYRVNVYTGDLKMVGENPGNISAGWRTIPVSCGWRWPPTASPTPCSTGNRGRGLHAVVTTNFKDTLAPLYFTFDNRYLYVVHQPGPGQTGHLPL